MSDKDFYTQPLLDKLSSDAWAIYLQSIEKEIVEMDESLFYMTLPSEFLSEAQKSRELKVYIRPTGQRVRFVETARKPGPENEGSWGAWAKDTFSDGTTVLITGRGFAYAYEVKEVTVPRPTVEKIAVKI